MVGPNCFGLINTSPQVRLNSTFGRVMPDHGNIALISQSGAIGVNALEYAESEEVGLSKFASIGNKADVNENDLLEYLRDDPETDVIALYLEDLVDPQRFMQLARETTSHPEHPKPILAIKSGRTSEGAKAASSHTGALAGSDEAFNAFFAQSRVLRVETINELFAKAAALAYQPAPKGNRVAILTNAGGIGIMATDACIANGLSLAKFDRQTESDLKKKLPATAATHNPVDVIGDSDEKRYAAALEIIAKDDNVDGLIPIWTPTLMAEAVVVARIIADIGQKSPKPVLACIQTMGDSSQIRRALRQDKIPLYQFPENAARAMAAMAQFAEWSKRPLGEIREFDDVDKESVRRTIDEAKARPTKWLSEPECHGILKAYGMPVLEFRIAKTADEAVAAAGQIGYPVVIKVVSPDILHKTDFGGVRVGIKDQNSMRIEFDAMMETVKTRKPDAEVWGVLVQQMAGSGDMTGIGPPIPDRVPGSTETILGMKRDPQFGPLLMFGLGGILVEVLRDVSFRVAPVNDQSADAMLTEIRAHRLLEGFRGAPPRDTQAIKDCIMRLSQLAVDFPEIDELDINPLLAYEQGQGAMVLDARILLKR